MSETRDHLLEKLRSVYADRRWIIATEVLAGATGHVKLQDRFVSGKVGELERELLLDRSGRSRQEAEPVPEVLAVVDAGRRRCRDEVVFDLEALHRYPHVSKICFVECSGNSRRNMLPEALDLTCGNLHGLLSTSEWTGIPLRVLLEEAGLDPAVARDGWVIAEGGDAGRMNRSLPMALSEDAMVALYQNGEPLRPAQGYPMRLLVPGCEGNLSVKWLRSLRVQSTAAYTRDETSKYTDLRDDGTAEMFTLRMDVKSTITRPSGRMSLPAPGVYEISGLAWSGHGEIRRVEVSADGGASWADALLQTESGDQRPTRFRIPWRWDGGPAVLQSRATDSRGVVQPSRDAYFSVNRPARFYHYNGIQSWAVDGDGRARNVHA